MLLILYKKKGFRYLYYGKRRINGRNYKHVTVYHRGGAHKRNFRLIDYLRYVWNVYAIVLRREYDPNKRIILNLICYANGVVCYILAVQGVAVGNKILNSVFLRSYIKGYTTCLGNFKPGQFVNNVELQVNLGSKYCRSLGGFAKILNRDIYGNVIVKLTKTKTNISINPLCLATVGLLIRTKFRRLALNKAGYTKLRGWRPHVRGYAMNPVDHPHGGRTKAGIQVSMWGKHTKGKKTKNKKKVSFYES